MDMGEFNEKVKPVTHGNELIFDVRVFGDRQGEAIDSYLHTRLLHTNTTGIGNTDKRVVLLCANVANIPNSARDWLVHLNNAGQSTEIRQA